MIFKFFKTFKIIQSICVRYHQTLKCQRNLDIVLSNQSEVIYTRFKCFKKNVKLKLYHINSNKKISSVAELQAQDIMY